VRGTSAGFKEAYESSGYAGKDEDVYAVYAVYANSKKLPDAKEFPVEAMPAACQQLIREATAAIGCPPDFVALPMLTTLGSAIGNSRVVKLKAGWEESATIYGAVIADPGEKKTPAMKVAVEPAIKQQAAFREAYRDKQDEYKREMRQYEVERKDASKNGLAAPPPPEEPVMERTVVEDTTTEALAAVLEGTPRGVAVMRDELSAWIRSMDQYKAGGKGADRQFYLAAWSGSYASVDRKGRQEPLILQRPFLDVFGAIQPDVLPEMGGGREDGLLDRFLFSYPESLPSRWTDDEITSGARSSYKVLYDGLRGLYMPVDDYGDPEPVRVALSPDAKEVLVEAINQHREEMEAVGFPVRLKGPWSKLEAYLARLSLILAMGRAVGEGAAERIEAQDVLKAVVLLDYFKNQARRVYTGLYGHSPEDRLAEDLASFLKKKGGSWRGQPSELHAQLKSEHKPSRADELGKLVRVIADRSPALAFEDGHEAIERNGKRTTRRYVVLTLRIGVNGVNGVNVKGNGAL
jgi:hypothetical protein